MTDIIFINPPLTMEERYGKLAQAGSLEPPHGLCNLAAVCLKENIDTEILDVPALGLSYEETVKTILQKSPKYVGITAVTISVHNAAKLAQMLKTADSKIVTIIGGPHLTALPAETMNKFLSFDIGVIGEGELTVIELIKTLDQKQPLDKTKGIIFRKNGTLATTDKREFVKNLDELPLPAWNLLPGMKNYRPAVASCKRLPSTSIMTTRGCTGKCTFCDRSGFGETIRGYSAEYIIKIIRHLQEKYSVRDIRIMDDNFILFRSKIVKVCELIKEQKIDISWSCLARVDMVNLETLKMVKEAGCWQIAYGIESGSQEILDMLNKNITLDQIRKTVLLTKEVKIKTLGYFMIGNPKETEETIAATQRLIRELDLDDIKITFFTPYPGSKIFQTAKQYGTFNDDWKKLDANLEPVFIPTGLTKEYLIKMQKTLLREFYLKPKTILSYLSRLNPGQIKSLYSAVKSFLSYTFSKTTPELKKPIENESKINKNKTNIIQIVIKYLKYFWLILTVIATFFAYITYVVLFSPKIELTPNILTKERFPFETLFILKNEGNFSINNIKCNVVDKMLFSGNVLGKKMLLYTNSPDFRVAVDTNPICVAHLSVKETTGIDIRKILGLLPEHLESGHFAVNISFKNWIIPYKYKRKFRFELIRTFDGKYELVPVSN